MSLEKQIKDGNIRAAARLMRDIEDDRPSATDSLKQLFPYTGNAHIVGITGPPGTGKSTLVDRLIGAYRAKGKTVGVLAIDPSSSLSGGAILGDRIRMQRHTLDKGVFIRSVATRGHLGGLSRSTHKLTMVLDAMGKDIIFIETVGVGQDEVEIAEIAHTNIVVIIPGLGDGIQTIKAGILETATIFVVNKADQEGAERTVCDIQSLLLHHSPLPKEWGKLILKTQAHKNMGIDELATAIDSHWHFLTQYQLQKRKKDHLKKCFINALQDTLFKKAMTILHTSGYMDTILKELENDKTDPYDAAEKMVDKLLLPESGI